MNVRRYINAVLVAVAFLGALGSELLFSSSGTEPSMPMTPLAGYTPTPGFEYFPAQYTNQATKTEDHVENF